MTIPAPLRVLVVDDEDIVINLVSTLLNSLGCEVVGSALDGAEGVRLFDELKPDLVLLDFMMPGLSGLDALKQILAIDAGAAVIMLTAVENREVSDDCILAGAKDYLRKDLKPEELSRRLADEIAAIFPA